MQQRHDHKCRFAEIFAEIPWERLSQAYYRTVALTNALGPPLLGHQTALGWERLLVIYQTLFDLGSWPISSKFLLPRSCQQPGKKCKPAEKTNDQKSEDPVPSYPLLSGCGHNCDFERQLSWRYEWNTNTVQRNILSYNYTGLGKLKFLGQTFIPAQLRHKSPKDFRITEVSVVPEFALLRTKSITLGVATAAKHVQYTIRGVQHYYLQDTQQQDGRTADLQRD
ncbi:hypothetical protein ASZ78_003410 [Callipepla squamata]|uniref:Uncharacterized protein n=1 Tax=Callipepla squamata TaxID=9009 RepID=A0A226NN46_CALSU|nr:hypothetical protein ASZ78_003410 [Callipepla squamata]